PPAHPATRPAHPPPDHSHTINEPEPKAFRINSNGRQFVQNGWLWNSWFAPGGEVPIGSTTW
ncbi:hypothetical protein, partial [Streptomyces nojiriensis]|uniref:hypothetical protein n=1 Tax=Streptomyces nojiriensis TaxID=66374 RepID=UPI001E642C43